MLVGISVMSGKKYKGSGRMKKTHKLVITPEIKLLDNHYTHRDKGNVIFKCNCGHEVEIRLSRDKDWPLLLATCDVNVEENYEKNRIKKT